MPRSRQQLTLIELNPVPNKWDGNNYEKWSRIPQLPKNVRLPGGFSVPVTLVSKPHKHLTEDADGVYDTDEGIFLWEGLTTRQKWLKLAHELKHAIADWDRWIDIKVGRS